MDVTSEYYPVRKLNGLYLLVGPSGSGKSSVEAKLSERLGCIPLRSYTDRPPRYGGEDSHCFLTAEQFDQLQDIVAYTKFAGRQYGATRELVDSSDTYVIDPRGVNELLDRYQTGRPIHIIGITAPYTIRKMRMEKRGDDAESIGKRLENERVDFGDMDMLCEIIVPNIKLEKTVDVVEMYIRACESAK